MKEIKPGYKETPIGILPRDWEVKSLAEIVDKNIKWSFTGGPFGSDLKSEHYTSSGVRVIQLQNIGDGKFLDNSKVFTSDEKANELISCNIYPGDIILSKMGDPVARGTIIPNFDDRYVMCSDGIRIVPDIKNFNIKYILEYINFDIFRKNADSSASGSTRKRIGLQELKKLLLAIPPKEEQEKIAQILMTWDEAIEKQEELIEQEKEFKKGMMQKIFSQKLRFKDENGNDYPEWEENRLGEIGKVSMCKRILKNQTSKIGEIPFYKIGTFGKKADAFITKELFESYKSKYSFPKIGEILLSASGTIGRKVVYDGKPGYFQDSNIIWISNNESLVKNKFLYYLYSNIKWVTENTTIARLYNNNIIDIKIIYPSLPEQEKIADFLSTIDEKIEILEKKLEEFKEQKKGLMQKLLTGEVRV